MARRVRNFKANDEEWALIKEKAREFSGGNVSKWLKRAGAEYQPAGNESDASRTLALPAKNSSD
jgi:hypothetical protein